jgi:hypothetical protein
MPVIAEAPFRPRGLTERFRAYLLQQNRSLESATPTDARAWVSSLSRTMKHGACIYTRSTARRYVDKLRQVIPCFDASVAEHVDDLARLRRWRPSKYPDPPMPIALLRTIASNQPEDNERDLFAKLIVAIIGACGVMPNIVMLVRDCEVDLRDDAVVFVFRRQQRAWHVEVARSSHEEVDVVRLVALWRRRMKLDGSTTQAFFVGNLNDGKDRSFRVKRPGAAALSGLYRALMHSKIAQGQWSWASVRRGHALKLLAAGLPREMIWSRMGFFNEHAFDEMLRATNRPDVVDAPL